MFYIYRLENQKNELYTGFTSDLRKRLREHNQGRTYSTKGQMWSCIYYEACLDEKDARRREKYLKKTQGQRMLKARLKEYFFKRRASRNFTTGIRS